MKHAVFCYVVNVVKQEAQLGGGLTFEVGGYEFVI